MASNVVVLDRDVFHQVMARLDALDNDVNKLRAILGDASVLIAVPNDREDKPTAPMDITSAARPYHG